MLIYIIHSDKFYTFRLPKEISGNYVLTDFDENGEKRSLVNIIADNSNWVINSNESVRIVSNGQFMDSAQLVPYNFYLLATDKDEKILVYVQPGYEDSFTLKKVNDNTTITIGLSEKNDIVYSSQSISAKQVELKYENQRWLMTNLDTNVSVFVNGMRTDSMALNNFDTIFIIGLKIVVCGNLIFINNPNGSVLSMSSKLTSNQDMLAVADKQNNASYSDFYDPDDYYSKSPVFLKKWNTLKVPITSPENKEQKASTSFLMQMIPMVLMQLTSGFYLITAFRDYFAGKIDDFSFMTTIIMTAVTIFLSFVWPFIERGIENFHRIVREKTRIRIYKRYLKGKREQLEQARNEQKSSLQFNYLSLTETQDVILKKNANLFSVNYDQDRFLKVRIGNGKTKFDCEIDYTKPDFLKEHDKLLDMIDELINDYQYIEDAPFVISLKNNIAFINKNAEYYKLYESIILKLAAFHDYANLKIIALTSENSKLSAVRSLNHCWDNERSIRFVATDIQEAETLSTYLMRIFNKRLTDNDNTMPYYLIITDEIEKYKNLKIISEVLNNKNNNIGFSILAFSHKLTDVPDTFKTFVDFDDQTASIFQTEMQDNGIISFKPELIDKTIDYEKCLRLIANIPVKLNDEVSGMLPDKFGFLEMFGVGNVDQLNSLNRWKDSKIISSLAAPIGVDSNNNTLYLDLHEKKHGPHGLIAGMTGSGKSEFIITYILSMAVNYSPDEVQFVLIDYKGGGLAGAFENRTTGIKLPHLVGTITNLDVSEMNRTLVSIKSELERRQKIFNAVKEQLNTGTIDIYKYQSLYREGVINKPLSHLFIICDEFAELKQSQPEFMDEIVSTSRIGRSLGIHLILATQKPAGVVDDQVWSNSKFKVCCKVQTVEDSKEMIRKEDAAYLKQSGRFYLQVGYDEYYVLGQSAYSGSQYIPSETKVSRYDNSVSFINDVGESYKNINPDDKNKENQEKISIGEELINVVKYLINVANKENYQYNQLWLDNVPEILSYNDVVNKYKVQAEQCNIVPLIGEFDNPRNQNQGPTFLPITTGGNTFIFGKSGSGKNTLLSTLIYSTIITHNSKEVNLYILDFGSEKLKKFRNAPQVGDVLTIEDSDKISYLMYMLQAEQYKRQKYYSENSSDFLYDVKKKQIPFPNIIVIIYEVDTFKESYAEIFEDMIVPLARNSAKYGIYFVISGLNTSSISYTASNYFPQKIALNMTDASDLTIFFDHPPVIKKNAGRGVINIDEIPYEFQTSIMFNEDEEVDKLQYLLAQLNKYVKNKAKPVPIIPNRVTVDFLKNEISTISRIPLGVNLITAQIGFYNFSNLINFIYSKEVETFIKFLPGLLSMIINSGKNRIIILNAYEESIEFGDPIKVYNSGFKSIIPVLQNNIQMYNNGEKSSDENYFIIICGYIRLNAHLNELKNENPGLINLYELITSTANNNFKFIIYDQYEDSRQYKKDEISKVLPDNSGIWLGKGFDEQSIIEPDRYNDNVELSDDSIITVIDGMTTYMKGIK